MMKHPPHPPPGYNQYHGHPGYYRGYLQMPPPYPEAAMHRMGGMPMTRPAFFPNHKPPVPDADLLTQQQYHEYMHAAATQWYHSQ